MENENVSNDDSLVNEYFEKIKNDFLEVEKELEKIEEERIIYEEFIAKNAISQDCQDLRGDEHIHQEELVQVIENISSESVTEKEQEKDDVAEEKINDILIQKIQNLNVKPKDIPKVILPSSDSKKENKESKCIIC
jgi:hypothetical protein